MKRRNIFYSAVGSRKMKTKIVGLFVWMLLTTTILPLTALAGDPEHPEIKDELNDTPLPFLDIVSAWFYEKADEPQYLYTALQLQSLNLKANAVLSIRWSYDGNEYVTGFDTYIFQQDVFRSGNPKNANYWQWRNMPECEGTVNRTTNVITWKVLKSNIGNPEKGDVLTNTRAAAVSGGYTSFFCFFTGRDYRDFAPNEQYGLDYVIQY
jgi:hypothetical protein